MTELALYHRCPRHAFFDPGRDSMEPGSSASSRRRQAKAAAPVKTDEESPHDDRRGLPTLLIWAG